MKAGKNGVPNREVLNTTPTNSNSERESKMQGTITKWFDARGFGFVRSDDGGDEVFVHATEVARAGLRPLTQGDRVEFEIGEGRAGRTMAINLAAA